MPTGTDFISAALPRVNAKTRLALIVDDEDDVRRPIATLLKHHGFLTLQAKNGNEALSILRETDREVDVVVMDVLMPECDGFEALYSMREDPVLREIPVIMLTAKTERNDTMTGYVLGADHYMPKPFDNCNLVQAVTALANGFKPTPTHPFDPR